jgi:enoyl-CoA hydratase/carnithine racemase
MPYKNIEYKKIRHLAVVSLNRQGNQQFNLLDLSSELKDLCDEIAEEERIRVIILTGFGGKPFPLGIKLSRNLSGARKESYQRLASLAQPVAELERPLIAAIDGDAIGLGLELALACDVRIAVDTSHFGLPQIRNGIIPWDGGTQRLSRVVGRGRALEMILTGEIIDAQEANRIGLVSRIVPAGQLMTSAMKLARQMASKAPIALRYAKEAINKGMDLTLEQGLRLEADLYFLLHTTQDRTEGIKAFREKRNPRFKGK